MGRASEALGSIGAWKGVSRGSVIGTEVHVELVK